MRELPTGLRVQVILPLEKTMTQMPTIPLLLILFAASLGLACESADSSTEDKDGDGLSVVDGDCDDSDALVGLAPFESADCEGTFERMVLHEMFGGSTCAPCAGADELLLDVLHQNEDRYVLLSYQIGSDPYVSAEGVARRRGYLPPPATGSYSIPWLQLDGANGFHPVEMNNDQGYTDADFDSYAAVPSHLGIEVQVSIEGQTVTSEITLQPGADYPSEDLVLHTAIIEGTTYANVGTNGQTEFHHVMKKMLPDAGGLSIEPLVRGEAVSFEQSWTFQGSYDDSTGISNMVDHTSAHTVEEFEDLSVIAFVQDRESLKIHQSIWSGQ